jgi:hypothetical protein
MRVRVPAREQEMLQIQLQRQMAKAVRQWVLARREKHSLCALTTSQHLLV